MVLPPEKPGDENLLKADLLERLVGGPNFCPDGKKVAEVNDWFSEDPPVVRRLISEMVSDDGIPIDYVDNSGREICVEQDANIKEVVWALS